MKSIRKLRAQIRRAGLAQRDVARAVGISEGALSNILSGRRTPGIQTGHALLAFLRSKGIAEGLTVETVWQGRAA